MHGSTHSVVGIVKLSGPIGQLIHVLEVLEKLQTLRAANMLRSMSIAAVPTPMLHFFYKMFPRVEWRAFFASDILGNRCSQLRSWQCMEKKKLPNALEAAGEMVPEDRAASSASASVSMREGPDLEEHDVSRKRCHYKHSWTEHGGPFQNIWMSRGKPKLRTVCMDCLVWLEGLQQEDYVKFELMPTEDAPDAD